MKDYRWMGRAVRRRAKGLAVLVAGVVLSGCASALNYGNVSREAHRTLVNAALEPQPTTPATTE